MNIRPFEQKSPKIDKTVFVDPTAVIVGDVEIDAGSSIWPHVSIRGDVHHIRIGARTSIQDNSVLHCTHDGQYCPGGYPLLIGDDVTVGHRVILHGCQIDGQSLIGMGAIILDNATIKPDVIIGAGALIAQNKVITSGLWLGSPAKKVRDLTDDEKTFIRYSAKHYVRLGERHLGGG